MLLVQSIYSSTVMLSAVKIMPADEGMILLEFSFQNGYPNKYNVSFSDEDENDLLVSLNGIGYDDKELALDLELNDWMRVAQDEEKGLQSTIISFQLEKRVPFKSEFKAGKLYVSFADVRYTNTVRTVLLWMAIPIALLFTTGAFFLVEN